MPPSQHPSTSTDGPTSEPARYAITRPEVPPQHTSALIEQHRIFQQVDASRQAMPGWVPPELEDEVTDLCLATAKAWAEANGLELGDIAKYRANRGRDAEVGVSFTVTVGKGDISADQSTPGALDSWRWSGGRLEWWRRVFNRQDGRQGRLLARREDGLATVSRLHREPPTAQSKGIQWPTEPPVTGLEDFAPALDDIWAPRASTTPLEVHTAASTACLCGLDALCPAHGPAKG